MLEEDKIFFESLGVKFDGDFGEYNYFACSQGILIANVLEDEQKIIEYNKLGCWICPCNRYKQEYRNEIDRID